VGKQEQLQWERKWAPLAAGAAFVAALVPFAAGIWGQSKLGQIDANRDDVLLQRIHDHAGVYQAAGIVAAIGMAFLAPVLVYLYRAIVARRPSIPRVALILAVLAPFVAAGTSIASSVAVVHVADQFVKEPLKPATASQKQKLESATTAKARQKVLDDIGPPGQARDKLNSGSLNTVRYISLVGTLMLGIAFVLIAMNAMRAGLVSRFMGILGVIVGALAVLPLFGAPGQAIQLFWVGAMGVLFLDRWPQGRGPAWEAVEEIPWPTAQERRDVAMGQAEPASASAPARGSRRQSEPEPAEVQHTREAARPRPSSTHPRSKKRKRKRRG
jgi:hypothetical protein